MVLLVVDTQKLITTPDYIISMRSNVLLNR